MKLRKFKLNKSLIICIFIFMIISIVTIYSAMTYLPDYLGNLAFKQFMWYLVGFFMIIIVNKISVENIYHFNWYIYITSILLLAILLVMGEPINGSKCWFTIPKIGSIQPSEFAKISLILTVSIITKNWAKKIRKVPTLKEEVILLAKIFIIWLIPSFLTFLEPDTGAVFIYSIIIIAILFVSPLRKRWFILAMILIGIGLGSFLFLYFLKKDIFVNIFGTELFYRIDRLLDWKNGTGMQLENSLTSIGSSSILGHGYNKTPIYFPESGTDFIFAVYASNFGLLGSIFLIVIILYFDITIIKIAKNASNITEKFTAVGILGILVYQQIQNIGMTLGILPITGITLPFISYGGSSLLSYMLMIGILLNIHNDTYKTIN
jgi:rod shape determining protein RodA